MILELEPVFNTNGSSYSFEYDMDFSELEVAGVHPVTKPVKISGVVKNNTGIVTLDANAVLDYCAPCDRCAETVETRFNVPVTHNLIVSLNDEENDDFLQVADMRLDLDEIVWEDVVLSLPVKYLCSEDCKGLCPQCGKNLNSDQCDCKKPIDPRLEGLLQFLE